VREGDATRLPWPDRSFDIVLQSTVLSSILDPAVRARIAEEMLRVTRPGGLILSYDFFVNNPANPGVRAVTARDLAHLFPTCRRSLHRVTLAPPLARRLAPRSLLLASVLEGLRVLNTHYLAALRPVE
jgi:ubiquinone/menaquinone biosynthesis C-methylase UbiE